MELLTRSEFIQAYWPDAVRATAGSGIFPEVLLVAAIVESQGQVNGTYYPGQSRLAKDAKNFFGIKGTGPAGSVLMNTNEYINGQLVTVASNFRKYNTVLESFADYVRFLKDNPRYTTGGVFNASTPAEQFQALQASGYATNPSYASLLTSVLNSLENTFSQLPRIVNNNGLLVMAAFLIYLIFTNGRKNKN
jgi:flagellum-specific peptidoglycan hydrolase FlgJ